MTDTATPPPAATTENTQNRGLPEPRLDASGPARSGPNGIRIATAIVGGVIAVLVIAGVALGQFASASWNRVASAHPIPASVTSIDVGTPIGDVIVIATPGAEPGIVIETVGLPWSLVVPTEVEVVGETMTVVGQERRGPCILGCAATTVRIELGDQRLESLTAASDVGSISIRDANADRIEARSNVGEVRVSAIAATSISAISDIGSVEIRVPESARQVVAESNIGEVVVRVPEGLEYDVRTTSELGEIRVDVPVSTTAVRSVVASSQLGGVRVVATP